MAAVPVKFAEDGRKREPAYGAAWAGWRSCALGRGHCMHNAAQLSLGILNLPPPYGPAAALPQFKLMLCGALAENSRWGRSGGFDERRFDCERRCRRAGSTSGERLDPADAQV